jgi:hypothetical protein
MEASEGEDVNIGNNLNRIIKITLTNPIIEE